MSEFRWDDKPMDIRFAPQGEEPGLPVEVLSRAGLIGRMARRELATRQRVGFHQLVLCTEGSGSHIIDFERVVFERGTIVHIHPGQVQQFLPDDDFGAVMVVWPTESHHADPASPAWFPGSSTPTRWQLQPEAHERFLGWIDELAQTQSQFEDTSPHRSLLQALLCALLMRLTIEVPAAAQTSTRLPQAYIDLRAKIEDRLYRRPTVTALAQELGYSTRTLDRACHQATGQTAREVLDNRLALEVRRLLTHTDRPLARIGAELGFNDPSNFSKFVKRNLGQRPSDIRARS